MKTLRILRILWILWLFLAMSFLKLLYAQTQSSAVTMSVPTLSKLDITNPNATITLVEDVSGEAAYEAGYVEGGANTPTLTVDSNKGWQLQVKVSTNWGLVGSYQKATGDLKLKVTSSTGHQTGFTDFTSLSLTDQQIATYTAGLDDDIYYGQYRILLSWATDIPGNYTITVTYTLSTLP